MQAVRRWLDSPAVALELTVERAFRGALVEQLAPSPFGGLITWSVDVSRTYVGFDPTASVNKVRETDVVVRMSQESAGGAFDLWLVIECKSGKDSPWVTFRRPRATKTWRASLADAGWFHFSRGDAITRVIGWSDSEFLQASSNLCYRASTTAMPDKNDSVKNHPRDAFRQVLSAVDGVANEIPPVTGVAMFVPIIVTSAPLFAVTSTLAGYQLQPSRRELVEFHHDPSDGTLRRVWIVGEDAIDDLATELVSLMGSIHIQA